MRRVRIYDNPEFADRLHDIYDYIDPAHRHLPERPVQVGENKLEYTVPNSPYLVNRMLNTTCALDMFGLLNAFLPFFDVLRSLSEHGVVSGYMYPYNIYVVEGRSFVPCFKVLNVNGIIYDSYMCPYYAFLLPEEVKVNFWNERTGSDDFQEVAKYISYEYNFVSNYANFTGLGEMETERRIDLIDRYIMGRVLLDIKERIAQLVGSGYTNYDMWNEYHEYVMCDLLEMNPDRVLDLEALKMIFFSGMMVAHKNGYTALFTRSHSVS